MAHMLVVAAFEFGYPVALVIEMKTGDASFHDCLKSRRVNR
jgi:hypothetical protein